MKGKKMIDAIAQNAVDKMQKSVNALKNELAKLRTGRAHPGLVEGVKVSYYGNLTPLSQMANITVEDPRTLSITPWEKNLVPVIEKAIMASNLGLNPSSVGAVIRVPLPPLTEERRKVLAKLVREETEKARIAIRNVRREANQDGKDLLKAKDITEDELHGVEDRIQKLTDQFIKEVDKICEEKEKDLMKV
jgi:ribosome recycling factor